MGSDVPVSTWMHTASLEFGSFTERNVELIYLLVSLVIIIMNEILLNLKPKWNKLTNFESSSLLLKSPTQKTSFCQIIIKAETTSQFILEIQPTLDHKTEFWQNRVKISYVAALLVHSPGQRHFRRIRQRGVLGLALIMALLVLDLWGHRQQGVGDSKTLLAAFVHLHWLVALQHQQKGSWSEYCF